MVKLRFARYGTTKKPFYRLVAADARRPRDGKFIEILGTYDPQNLSRAKTSEDRPAKGIVDLKEDRVTYWLKNGAQVSDTVKSILKDRKLLLTQQKAS